MNLTTVLLAMLPEHLLLAGIVLLLLLALAGAPTRRAGLPVALVALLAAALAALALHVDGANLTPFRGQFSVTPQAALAKALLLALAAPVLLLSRDQFAEDLRFYALLLASLYGVCLMLSADSFLTLFLGLELMSLPVYTLVLLAFRRPDAAEAALKYLVLGGAATATFLMGVSLLFGGTGSLGLDAFAIGLQTPGILTGSGVALIVAAFFLKAAVVPFHAWAPDAYEGATVPVTAYMATLIKGAVLLAAVRVFGSAQLEPALAGLVIWLPLASIVWGNLAAIRQSSFRRMIAYSSIAHAGYLFFVFLGAPAGRFQAVAFYVAAYSLANLLAFAALPHAAGRSGDHPARDLAQADARADSLAALKGLWQRAPFAALMLGLAMLSLAGIPPLPGFVGKFLIFRNVMEGGYTLVAVLGLVGSYLGIYFYLRAIQYAFMATPDAAAAPAVLPARGAAVVAAVLCLVPVALLMLFPGALLARL
jgi:NADH-quinone oxidoreductase subunit N